MTGAIIHTVAAIVLLKALLPLVIDAIGVSAIPGATYVQVFGVALPLFSRVSQRRLGDARGAGLLR